MYIDKQFSRILFLLSVLLLLVNDFYLKDSFHNEITGKLSDISGLFAFPYFISLFFPKNIKRNYFIVAFLFILWKSEYIEPVLIWFQSIGFGLNRTVDYTDLYALFILPISYFYWYSKSKIIIQTPNVFKPIVICICSFAFIATSLPKEYVNVNIKSNLEIKLEANSIQDLVKEMNLEVIDSVNFYATSYISDKNTEIKFRIKVTEINEFIYSIKLDTIVEYETEGRLFFGIDEDDKENMKKLKLKDYEKIFLESKILPLYNN